jgi:DNA-binding NarL/FixJ family response regulator
MNNLSLNLKVLLFDSDYYALQAINSYMAWDRRTRVMHYTHEISSFWRYLENVHFAEVPDVVVLDGEHLGGADALVQTLRSIHKHAPKAHIICLTQSLDPSLTEASAKAHARACLLKGDVQLQITWAVCHAIAQEFTITRSMLGQARHAHHPRLYNAHILPEPRNYPEMTDRIRQAIKLCVIEGMPAHLAADEMGISLHTIRGYIKEGYRILESYDTLEYPTDMTPQERAFMRFTALAEEK